MKQFETRILENRVVAESWRELRLSWDEDAGEPLPGQFLTLRVSPYSDPLLRRPFAFSGFRRAFSGRGGASGPRHGAGGEPAQVAVVYQIRGKATQLLSGLTPGELVDAIAPLGKPFPPPAAGEAPILAGGGIGLGPLLFLAAHLSEASRAGAGPAPLLVLGVRSAGLLPSMALPEGTVICTDDGSSGFKGTPVDWISRNAEAVTGGGRARLYGCGPGPMLAALAGLAADRGWAASLSAEQRMACGVGACMGCALPRADGLGYYRACTDGPVFDGPVIDWGGGR